MAKEGPDWQGLLKWSLAHTDGTQPPRNLSDEDRKWFMEAMQGQTVDIIKRMKEITVVMQIPEDVLESQGVTVSDVEGMLEELQEHVESIDMANDLHSIGGLVPLLGYLKSSHAGIRARAAEVVTTIVQNNPRGQQLVMEANGIEPLFQNFSSDPDVNARTKALGAISSLIRHNKSGIAAFRLANGYASLKDALSSDSVQFQRKALHLLEYLLGENSSDVKVVIELGFTRIFMHLALSEDGEIREAALGGLLELVKDRTGEPSSSSALGEDSGKMKQVLEERIKGISEMNSDDLLAAKGERQLVDLLWSVCYNEPSSLREKGLLSIPGDDAPPPDVVGNLFEPPVRSHATRAAPDEKKDANVAPLLLGLGSPNPSL